MKKTKLLLSFMAMFALIITVVGCSGTVSAAQAYVTVDINPSIELVINEKEVVVYANALNEDAEVLLLELEVVGLNVDDAMELIIAKAIELGYIDVDAEEVYVEVSSTSDQGIGEQIKLKVMAAINTAFKNRLMMGKAQAKVFTDDFILEAEGYGVTPQFLCLAYNATYADDEITLEAALQMEQQDLIDMIKATKASYKNIAQTYKQEFLQAREEIKNMYQPQIAAMVGQIDLLNEQIAATTGDTTALEAQIQTLNSQMTALQETMQLELQNLRTEYREKSSDLVETFQAAVEQRQNMFQTKVQNWLNNISNRKHAYTEEEIDNFQKNKA